MPTSRDVIALAYKRLGIGIDGDAPNGGEGALARDTLDSIWGEIESEAWAPWGIEALPAAMLVPLATLLAADLAPSFGMQPVGRGAAKLRVMALVRPDNRVGVTDPVAY